MPVKAVRSRSSATAHAKAVSSTFCAKIRPSPLKWTAALDEHDVACQCGYYFASVTGVGHVEFLDGEEKLVALTSLMRHMAGREDQFTEQQARTVEVFAVRADKLSAKAKVPHSAQ